jgi:4'-phosphopantetheinyl transferase
MNPGHELNLLPEPLTDASVHVWVANLDASAAKLYSLKQTLSADEHARAERFLSERDQNRFITGRGLLRTLLGSYLDRPPEQLEFAYSPRGKPALANASGQHELHFNLAHSHGLILIAVTRACPLGVDVEQVRPINEAEGIAKRFFTPGEIAKLKALPEAQRLAAFFNLWTRKEAYLKATGEGLEMLNQIEVSCAPGDPARVLAISGNTATAQSWMLAELAPAPGFVGALAAPATGLELSCRPWHL